MKSHAFRVFHLAALLFWIGLLTARAHQAGLSTVLVQLGTNRLTAQLTFAWPELEALTPMDANHDRELSDGEFAAARPFLLKHGEPALAFESDGRMLALTAPIEVQREDTNGLRFSFTFEFPATRVLTLNSEILAELPRTHRQIVTVLRADGSSLGEAVLDRDRPSVDVPQFTLTQKKQLHGVRDFLVLGVEHILTGWDHLAFLFGLLVIGGGLRDAIKIITSFTVAHSLTLVLATFNVINIPSSYVEPLIAASIVYVGFENILRHDFHNRWMLTFAFGLIHGCGFASVLREMGLGANGTSVVTPLVCFNLGVEAGQLALAAVMLPLIWKLKPKFPKRWLPVTSVGLILIGSYFLVDRLWPRTDVAPGPLKQAGQGTPAVHREMAASAGTSNLN